MATQNDDERLSGYTVLDGQFGTVRPEIRMAFPYFGQTIRVHPNASDVEWMGFIERMRHIPAAEVDESEAMAATLDYIRGQIHPDDWNLFLATATANRQNSMDLMTVAQTIVAAVADFPTGAADDSARGQRPTDHLSRGGSSRRERRGGKSGNDEKKRRRLEATARAIRNEDRADVKLLLLEAYEQQQGIRYDVDGTVSRTA